MYPKVIFFIFFGNCFFIFCISLKFFKPGFSRKIFLSYLRTFCNNLKFFEGGVAKKKNFFLLSFKRASKFSPIKILSGNLFFNISDFFFISVENSKFFYIKFN